MVLMGFRELIKKITGPVPVISVSAILLLLLSAFIVELLGDESAGQIHFWVIVTGTIGIAILIFFLIANIFVLIRQYLRNEIGSRLTVKLVAIFLLLLLIPFSILYYFSSQFLNKGIDSWFDVQVEQAVQDALLLGQTSLEAITQEIVSDVESYARNLTQNMDRGQLLRALDDIRELDDYTEVSVFSSDGRILAFSSDNPDLMLPDTPGQNVIADISLNQTYTSLEPLTNNSQQLRVVTPVHASELSSSFYALQVITLLPLRYAELANSVETALNQYDQMVFARGPLKFSLILTLSIISVASLLFSILTAVYLSRRIVAPISSLAAGTQKIAEGGYGTALPITSGDELGILIESFNHMSSKIEADQHAIVSSQQETEAQKAYLETILTNLSSGVFVFDNNKNLQICNSEANDILGISLANDIGAALSDLINQHMPLVPFLNRVKAGIQSDNKSWQDEINLLGSHGRQMLIIRGSKLTSGSNGDNHIIVFDDVTSLIQAQRDAAWGEVARRLAHEIKNPLTPIQLSAERIQHKFNDQVNAEQREILERSTRTIVQQVESMKDMVNAFSSYAQPVRAKLEPLDVNQLLRDVMELHTANLPNIGINFQLNDELPKIKGNAGALRQVFNNLIINACHALEEMSHGKINLRSKFSDQFDGHYIDINIEDNGEGIAPELSESIFDPYVSSKAKGSGLGLAIVKRIVEEHSGSVWAEPLATGGTSFTLRLPINALQTYRGNRQQNALQSENEKDNSGRTT